MTASEEIISLKGQKPATLQVIDNVRSNAVCLLKKRIEYIFMDVVSACTFTDIYCNFNCEAK